MATNTAVGSIVSQNGYNSGWNGYGEEAQYAGVYSSKYYVCIVQIKTPEFIGVSEKLVFSFGATQMYGSNPVLRYALCTSDKNKGSYLNTHGEVADATRIATGTVQLSGITSSNKTYTVEIPTTELTPSTTYYLYFWASGSSNNYCQIGATSKESVAVDYNSGLVYIDNGSGFDAYQCYIDNGSGWDLHIPYADNGSGWDMCG